MSTDPSASPLGPRDTWPPALQHAVRLMKNSLQPMAVGWGPELVLFWNDACGAALGPRLQAPAGRLPARHVWAERWPVLGPAIESVLAGQGPAWIVEPMGLANDARDRASDDAGGWAWSCSPIEDDTAPRGVGGVLLVASETPAGLQRRQRAQAALQASEARYRSALRAGRLGAWETDLQGLERRWTPEGMALFGLDLPQGRGQVGGPNDEYAAAFHPDDRHLAAHFRELADRQDAFAAEYRIVRPDDGSTRWLSGHGLVTERTPDGRALRLVSIMADATERKQAEQVLQVERERLELALSAGQMGTYDMDVLRGELWWSPQMYRLLELDPETFRPTLASVAALLEPADQPAFLSTRQRALANRQPFQYEFRRPRADGTDAWFHIRDHGAYDSQGRLVRSYGLVMDVTERRRAEQALRDADQAKDRFIATLAHELRNPLAPIRHAVSVLRQPQADAEAVRWCHDVIERQVRQMARLLDDLLDVSRIGRNRLQLEREPLRLATVIEQAIEIAQPAIDAGHHAFRAEIDDDEARVVGDAVRLAQVFSNILINAAKYTPPGGRIALRMMSSDTLGSEGPPCGPGEVVVRIVDNGIGIAPEHLELIFEVFGQVEGARERSQGGQGLGLSLAKGLVELHGGRIVAHSEGPGRGSRFDVVLPRAPHAPPVAAADPDAASFPTAVGAAAHRSRRVLIADDLADNADTLAALLRALGHEATVAYDGEQALALALATRPEVVLLDLGMPRLDGLEVCRRIRATDWGRQTLLIAQTGWGQAEDRRRSAEAGFDHHVVKPVDAQVLLGLLAER